jgi:copper resistance protein C
VRPHPQAARPRLRSVTAALLIAAASGLSLLLTAPPASAHDALVSTAPADGTTLDTAPTSIVLTFEEPPLTIGMGVAVTAPDGSPVEAGKPTLAGSVITSTLPRLTATGQYAVSWRIVADDGHPVTGTFHFTLAVTSSSPSATATSVASTAAAAGVASPSSTNLAPWLVGGAIVVVVVGGIALARRRNG